MQKLRSLHLYLGCLFAPLLLFFAVSGIWQTFGWHFKGGPPAPLSSVPNQRGLKDGANLSSPWLGFFVLIMAAAFILTTVLGIIMALKFGRNRRAAIGCLIAGVLVPAVFIVIAALQHSGAR